ncbi:MAG TPA: Uma2 family endonuclease [Ohtaekwangia sp.]|uniref:Uma2 family endonuclease n=1 Tax=Ohtaekwangia sp. TaxID=2066019 RepID=UPI002F925AB6
MKEVFICRHLSSGSHQRIVAILSSKMILFTEETKTGEVYVAPFDVYLDEHLNAVQPDIVFVSASRLSIIERHIHGVPDLIVEVLSEGNENHDKIRKKKLYEQFGVKEYWIIDPETKEATGYSLNDNQYQEIDRSLGKITSRILNYTFDF